MCIVLLVCFVKKNPKRRCKEGSMTDGNKNHLKIQQKSKCLHSCFEKKASKS